MSDTYHEDGTPYLDPKIQADHDTVARCRRLAEELLLRAKAVGGVPTRPDYPDVSAERAAREAWAWARATDAAITEGADEYDHELWKQRTKGVAVE